jgi:hypothetical protein
MRQSLATTLVLFVWLTDLREGVSCAPHTRLADGAAMRRGRLALAALAIGFALYIDFFAIVVVPGAVCFWMACAADPLKVEHVLRGRTLRIAVAIALFFVTIAVGTGIVPWARVASKLTLLTHTCLPFALGTTVFIKGEALVAQPWSAPPPIFLIQIVGALVFSASVLFAGPAAFSTRIPWPIRRLGLLGVVTTLVTLAAFVVSTKPVDMWSSRYLAPIFWFAPFSLAPLGWCLRPRRLALLQLPYWLTALIGGWLSYGLWVDGALPRHPPDAGRAEQVLRGMLLERGIHEAEAQYWLAYRLAFLFEEDPIVVPIDRKDDRYGPYRVRADAAKDRAFIFHPSEPRAVPGPYEDDLRVRGVPFERREVAGYTVLVIRQGPR